MITAHEASAITIEVRRKQNQDRIEQEKKSLEQWLEDHQSIIEEISSEITKAANAGEREVRFQYQIGDEKASNNWKYLVLFLKNNKYTVVQDPAGHMTNALIVTQKVTW